MNAEAARIVAALRLEPLPYEGGFFRPTWRSERGSAILFLITPDQFSALHRIAQDELWHFHAGDAVEHVQLGAGGAAAGKGCTVTRLGGDVLGGETPQVPVPRGRWQGARIAPGGRRGFALLGCTLTPPWDEAGFELGAPTTLTREFPDAAEWIGWLTR